MSYLAVAPLLLGWTSSAKGALLLVAEIADDDVREGLRARGDLLRAVGRIPGVVIAPLSKFERLTRAAGLDPAAFDTARVAAEVGKVGELSAVLSDRVQERNGGRTLALSARDRHGELILQRSLDLSVGQLLPDELELVASELRSALGLDPPFATRRAVVRSIAIGPTQTKPDTPATAERNAILPAPQRDDQAASGAAPARFQNPGVQFELGVRPSLLRSTVTNTARLGNCPAESAGCASRLGSSLYPGLVGRVQAFPFHARFDALAGLGLIAGGSIAELKIAGSEPKRLLSTRDARIDANVVYRLGLSFGGEGAATLFSPSLGLRAGLVLDDLDVPSGDPQVHTLDRFGAYFGAEILEPLGSHFRLVVGGGLTISPTPGGDADKVLNSQRTLSDGFELSGELQVRVGRTNTSGFTASMRGGYRRFDDCFQAAAGDACAFTGAQTRIDLDALVGYAFY